MGITNLNIAQQEKDNNRDAYVNSLKDFWLAYYELRQLTLYDFDTNEDLITEFTNK
jgi:outer membrane protein TolC